MAGNREVEIVKFKNTDILFTHGTALEEEYGTKEWLSLRQAKKL